VTLGPWNNALFSLAPTVIAGLLFWYVMRGIIRLDRTERKVYAKIEAEERAKAAAAAPPTPSDPE
jgi:hypothetical protein